MILNEKLEHGMEYENGQENIEKLRRIGGQILAASRDEPVSYTHLTSTL